MTGNTEVSFEGSMTERFLCFKAESTEDDFRVKMLENNRVIGYLPLTTYETLENITVYRYEITDMISLSDYLIDHEVTAEFLAEILGSLEKIFLRGRGFMLEEDNYVLQLNYMFLDTNGDLQICYLPTYESDVKHQITSLIGDLLKMVDTEDKTNVFLMYRAYAKAGEDSCTFRSIINCLSHEQLPAENEAENEFLPVSAASKEEADPPRKKKLMGRKAREALEYIAVITAFTLVVLFFIFK